MIPFTALLHRAAVADIGRILQLAAGSALVVPTILKSVTFLAELTSAETTVLRFFRTEVLSQAAVEMQAIITLVAASRAKSTALFHLSGYGRRGSSDHSSDDLKRIAENESFLNHGPFGHA